MVSRRDSLSQKLKLIIALPAFMSVSAMTVLVYYFIPWRLLTVAPEVVICWDLYFY